MQIPAGLYLLAGCAGRRLLFVACVMPNDRPYCCCFNSRVLPDFVGVAIAAPRGWDCVFVMRAPLTDQSNWRYHLSSARKFEPMVSDVPPPPSGLPVVSTR